MMDKIIYNYHRSSYIPEIQKFEFHITHVQITGTSNCGESLQTAFKSRESFQDVLCHRDYGERRVASFPIKHNQNTMVEIYPCLLSVLH